jgi:hypothetical protein
MLGQERSGPRNGHCGSSSPASCSWRRSALTGGADGTCPWFDNHLYLACSVVPRSFFSYPALGSFLEATAMSLHAHGKYAYEGLLIDGPPMAFSVNSPCTTLYYQKEKKLGSTLMLTHLSYRTFFLSSTDLALVISFALT